MRGLLSFRTHANRSASRSRGLLSHAVSFRSLTQFRPTRSASNRSAKHSRGPVDRSVTSRVRMPRSAIESAKARDEDVPANARRPPGRSRRAPSSIGTRPRPPQTRSRGCPQHIEQIEPPSAGQLRLPLRCLQKLHTATATFRSPLASATQCLAVVPQDPRPRLGVGDLATRRGCGPRAHSRRATPRCHQLLRQLGSRRGCASSA